MDWPSGGAEELVRRPLGLYHSGLLVIAVACGGPPTAPPLRTGPTKVTWFTSPDGLGWTQQPDVLAEHFVSLGLSVRDDGALWVTGIDQSGAERSWFDRTFGSPTAGGLVFDGATWTRTTWSVDADAPALLDPQWLGDTLWFVGRAGGPGDPAEARQVRIQSAPPDITWLTGDGITDPSPIHFHEELHLFVSERDHGVVHHVGQPLQQVQRWNGVQVPSAVVVGDELWLVAQKRIRARRQPVVARSADGRTFSRFEPLLPDGAVEHCTSPVVGPNPAGGLVLLCVEERPPEYAP
jgi:hypothetical protein